MEGMEKHWTCIPAAIATAVLGGFNLQTVFNEPDDHMTDSAADKNHVYSLIKAIVKSNCTTLKRKTIRRCQDLRFLDTSDRKIMFGTTK